MTEAFSAAAIELQRSNALMRELLAFGTSLSAKASLPDLIDKILFTAKSLCCADAGILYLQSTLLSRTERQASHLGAVAVQIDALQLRLNQLQSPNCLPAAVVHLTAEESLVMQAALAGTPIAIDDLTVAAARDEQRFDQAYGYRSISALAVPFHDSQGQVLGVVKLLNSRNPDTDQILPFDPMLHQIMQWFAAQVGNALEDLDLRQNQASWLKAEQEIQVGRKIQLDFLPETLPQVKGWEIAARFYPAREVAGDFYDVFPMGHGRIGIVIADVCDKGVGAALFMSLFRSFLRILAQQNYALNLLDSLIDSAPQSQQDRQSRLPSIGTQALKNAMERTNNYIAETHCRTNMFATIFFGVLDPVTGKLIYINGGHESPLICNAEGIKHRLTRTGPAVGVFPNAKFKIELAQLEPGDILLGYTDGIPDARSPQHERYTEQRLCQLIESTSTDSAAGLLDQVDRAVHQHIDGIDPYDDITLIAVRRAV